MTIMKTQAFNVEFIGRAINFDSSPSFYTRSIKAIIEVPRDLDAAAQVTAIETRARELYLDDVADFVKEKQASSDTDKDVNLEVQLLTSFNWRPAISFERCVVL